MSRLHSFIYSKHRCSSPSSFQPSHLPKSACAQSDHVLDPATCWLLQATASASDQLIMTASTESMMLLISVCGLADAAARNGDVADAPAIWSARYPAQQSRHLAGIGGSPSADVRCAGRQEVACVQEDDRYTCFALLRQLMKPYTNCTTELPAYPKPFAAWQVAVIKRCEAQSAAGKGRCSELERYMANCIKVGGEC